MVGDLRKQQVNNGEATAAGLKLPTQHIAARNPSKCCGFEKQPKFSCDQYFQPPCRLDYPPFGSSDREQNSRPKTSAPMSF